MGWRRREGWAQRTWEPFTTESVEREWRSVAVIPRSEEEREEAREKPVSWV